MRNVVGAAAAVVLAWLAIALLGNWQEVVKYLAPSSATVAIQSTQTAITAYEPVVTGFAGEDFERKAKVVLVRAGKPFTVFLSSTGDLMPTPGIGLYVDGEGSVIVSGAWETFRLRSGDADLERLPSTIGSVDPRAIMTGVVDINRVALENATRANATICSPLGLTPSIYLPGACFVGSFNFDGASRHRRGSYWTSSKWHYAPATQRAEFFENTAP